jgi:hypothetical protein
MRYALKRDDNERSICEFLRVHGYRVWLVDGCPFDLLVYRDDVPAFLLLECKSRRGRKTQEQIDFEASFVGRKPHAIIRSEDEALAAAKKWL